MGKDSDTAAARRNGLVFALEFDGRHGARPLNWAGLEQAWPDPPVVWLHMDYTAQGAQEWLRTRSGVSEAQCDYLLADETRPGLYVTGQTLLLILRVLNRNPGEAPEDMVSVRIWMTGNRIASMRMRKAFVLQEMHDDLRAGKGPASAGEFLGDLMGRLAVEFHDYVFDMEKQFDAIEATLAPGEGRIEAEAEAELRIKLVDTRRFLLPQIHLVEQLTNARLDWLPEESRLDLRNAQERFRRVVDDLELILHRLEVFRDERGRRAQEVLNQRMYVLAIITAVFLPLSLIAGLLGMNVGGVPGADTELGFAIVCGGLGFLAVVSLVLLRSWRWF